MSQLRYCDFNFRQRSLRIIETANAIISEYQAEGYDLTLRQLYYQFVARDIIPNTESEYSKLGNVVSNGRLAGLIDWNAIVDRTRSVKGGDHFDSPQEIVEACAEQYELDTRDTQDTYIEVWIEKEALLGVIERVCEALDVVYLACRGYYSQSAMWRASRRILSNDDKSIVILHLGDHDPSGIDMTRDIDERLQTFRADARIERIALNMEQVKKYNPPPNPAKLSDSRCSSYISKYGSSSWELDALDPKIITKLVRTTINKYTDAKRRQARMKQQEQDRADLRYVADNWTDIAGNGNVGR